MSHPQTSLPARCVIAAAQCYALARPCLPWPTTCRFSPSCSTYAIDACQHYGARRGVRLLLWRLLRCHPWSRGGYDPA